MVRREQMRIESESILPESSRSELNTRAGSFGAPVGLARRISGRAAGARQRQYIGKLMRQVDLDPIRAALAARSARDARETERFRRIENWRERLITEGETALEELAHWYPAIDVAAWRERIAASRAERQRTGASGAAARELFRALRALFATMNT